MKFFLQLIVGFCICTAVTCVMTGGLEEGFSLMLISIVCTAGVGLGVWIPMWWVTGWLTLLCLQLILGARGHFLSSMGEKPVAATPGAGDAATFDQRQQALQRYFRQARQKGMDLEVFCERLRSCGWDQDEIQWARQGYLSPGAAAP